MSKSDIVHFDFRAEGLSHTKFYCQSIYAPFQQDNQG
jgi:hypothetical protein